MAYIIDGGGSSALWQVYLTLREIAADLRNVAFAVSEIPVLGPVFYGPLMTVSNWLYSAAAFVMDFEWFYYQLTLAVQSFLDGEGFGELLDLLFPEWSMIRDNPVTWILGKLSLAMPTVYSLVFTPFSWLVSLLETIWPEAGAFLSDPLGWFLEMFALAFPAMSSFVVDPLAYILAIIEPLLADIAWFLEDPWAYLLGKLSELLGVEVSFWADPWGNALDHGLSVLDDRKATLKVSLLHHGERVLRYLWEGV